MKKVQAIICNFTATVVKQTIPHGYQKPENEKEQLRKPTVELKQFSKIKYDRYEQTTNMIASVL